MVNACWTTISTDEPIGGRRLLEICQVHFLHIGMHMFAELKLKPFVPVNMPARSEAPRTAIPSNDDVSDTTSAMDLTVKHVDGSTETDSIISTHGS